MLSRISLVCLILALGCGQESKKEKNDQSPSNGAVDSSSERTSPVPVGTVLVVPLDENGAEIVDAAQMRPVYQSLQGASAEEIVTAFNSAEDINPDRVRSYGDDLSGSSTQMTWGGWGRSHGYGGYGHQTYVGRQAGPGCSGGFGYCGYQPRCGYAGNVHNYRPEQYGQYVGVVQYRYNGYRSGVNPYPRLPSCRQSCVQPRGCGCGGQHHAYYFHNVRRTSCGGRRC